MDYNFSGEIPDDHTRWAWKATPVDITHTSFTGMTFQTEEKEKQSVGQYVNKNSNPFNFYIDGD